MSPELAKTRAVAEEAAHAVNAASLRLTDAARYETAGDHASAAASIDLANRALLSVYAKIGTLRHNGTQPERRPA